MASRDEGNPAFHSHARARSRGAFYDHARVFERVESHLALEPGASLTEIAGRAGVERHTIERAVRERTGHSFREYQRAVRLEAARQYLRTRLDLSVKQIAACLNYQGARAFARFFRRQAGINPSAYRRQFLQPASPQARTAGGGTVSAA